MARLLGVWSCLLAGVVGVAPPAIMPSTVKHVTLPAKAGVSQVSASNVGVVAAPAVVSSYTAQLAPGLRGYAPGLRSTPLTSADDKLPEAREAQLGQQRVSQNVQAPTASILRASALGATVLAVLAAGFAAGSRWARRAEAVKTKDLEVEMTASNSLLWSHFERPTFAMAAFAGNSIVKDVDNTALRARGGYYDDEDSLSAFVGINSSEWLEGEVVSTTNFGAFVEVTAPTGERAQGLVHVSQIKNGFVDRVADEVEQGQGVKVRVLSVDEYRNRMSLTMRDGSDGGRPEREPNNLSAFENFDSEEWLDGKVASVAPFGAFVEVPAPDGEGSGRGLVHVSKLRDGFVEDVYSEVSEGQDVKVRIEAVDVMNGKMSLSMREFRRPDDFSAFEGLPSDQWLVGKVVSTTSFGAFVEVTAPDSEAAAQGLVHVTQISDGYVENVDDEVEVGQEVKVRVQSVENNKMSLSMVEERDSWNDDEDYD